MADEPDEPRHGMIVTIRECGRCGRILALTCGDDCPDHTLPCCRGKGSLHAAGCKKDPLYIAGVKRAMELEKAFLKAILG